MAEPLPPPSLARAREQKISELSQYFANDDLSLEDLERRIERVYKAASIADLDSITADLRLAAPLAPQAMDPAREAMVDPRMAPMPAGIELPRSRILAFMSSTRRVGRWAVPRDLTMFAMMSDSRIDLTNAALPAGGIVNVHLKAIMAAVKVIVPPGMRVINELHSIMSDVGSAADELPVDGLTDPRTPIIRLTGTAFMSEVKVKVRRREDASYDAADDD